MIIYQLNFYKTCDYIPIVSSFTNAYVLCVQAINCFKKTNEELILGSFQAYVAEKKVLRCVILIILPFIGNVLIAFYDLSASKPSTTIATPSLQNVQATSASQPNTMIDIPVSSEKEETSSTSVQGKSENSPSRNWEIIGCDGWQTIYSFLTFKEQLFLGTRICYKFYQAKNISCALGVYSYFYCKNPKVTAGYVQRSKGNWSFSYSCKLPKHAFDLYRTTSNEIVRVSRPADRDTNNLVYVGPSFYEVYFQDSINHPAGTAYREVAAEFRLRFSEKIFKALQNQLDHTEPVERHFSSEKFKLALSKINWFSSPRRS